MKEGKVEGYVEVFKHFVLVPLAVIICTDIRPVIQLVLRRTGNQLHIDVICSGALVK